MGSSFFRGFCFFAANSQMDQERQGSPQQDDAAHQGQLTKIPHNHGAKNLAAQAGASALAAAAILHYNKTDVPRLKAELRAGGLEVRA